MKKFLKWVPFLMASMAMVSLFLLSPEGALIAPFGAVGAVACQRLQSSLVNYFGRNIALYRTGGDTALIKWLLSPQNTRGFNRIDVESIPGKKRGVAFRVDLPYCFNLCSLAVDCTYSETVYVDPDSGEMVFDLTNPPYRHCDGAGKAVKLRFKEDTLMKFCTETDTSYIENKIAQYLLEWEQAFDKVLTTLIATQVGTNGAATPAAVTNVPIFIEGNNTTPGVSVLNPDAVWYIDQLFRDMGFNGQYALIGGTITSKLAQHQKWVSANSAGVDLSKDLGDQPLPFYDRNFNTTFGPSDMLQIAPGVTQLITWNKYKGEKRRQVTNLYSKGTVILPTTGLEVDWKWVYDYECEEWTFEAFLHAELATVPAGGCLTQHAGVNGIVRLHDCGVTSLVPVCPEPEV